MTRVPNVSALPDRPIGSLVRYFPGDRHLLCNPAGRASRPSQQADATTERGFPRQTNVNWVGHIGNNQNADMPQP